MNHEVPDFHYMSCRYTQLRPRFSTETGPQGDITKVILPNNSPIRSATGYPQPNKVLATSSACLETLKLLYEVASMPWPATVPEFIPERLDDC